MAPKHSQATKPPRNAAPHPTTTPPAPTADKSSHMLRTPLLPLRLSKLLSGLFLYGIAISLMVRAGLGIAP